MAPALDHAQSSAQQFGGRAMDYYAIHDYFDCTKAFLSDFRHRACRHHVEGIDWAIAQFGVSLLNSDREEVHVRTIGEQHLLEDFSRFPTFADWWGDALPPQDVTLTTHDPTGLLLAHVTPQKWMCAGAHKLTVG